MATYLFVSSIIATFTHLQHFQLVGNQFMKYSPHLLLLFLKHHREARYDDFSMYFENLLSLKTNTIDSLVDLI